MSIPKSSSLLLLLLASSLLLAAAVANPPLKCGAAASDAAFVQCLGVRYNVLGRQAVAFQKVEAIPLPGGPLIVDFQLSPADGERLSKNVGSLERWDWGRILLHEMRSYWPTLDTTAHLGWTVPSTNYLHTTSDPCNPGSEYTFVARLLSVSYTKAGGDVINVCYR